MLILNDVHLSFRREGGTTHASQEAMRDYLFTQFEEILVSSAEKDLFIVGDLFDEFEISPRNWLQTYQILQDWCVQHPGVLTLMAGNHDVSPKALRVSSFQMLCDVLLSQFGPDKVQVIGIDHFAMVGKDSIGLAHCSNQDVFNAKLEEVLTAVSHVHTITHVFLHANYDNNFAANSDHSLNVTEEQALRFAERGINLVFAHEHQARSKGFFNKTGRVIVMGNQWPTSIADCLNNDMKYAHVLRSGTLEKVPTWGCGGENGYQEVDWTAIANGEDVAAKFVRVAGKATTTQAGEVVSAIAKFRSRSDAFVITNAVKVEGIAEAEALPASFEAAKTFDVWEYLEQHLNAEELGAVNKLKELME